MTKNASYTVVCDQCAKKRVVFGQDNFLILLVDLIMQEGWLLMPTRDYCKECVAARAGGPT